MPTAQAKCRLDGHLSGVIDGRLLRGAACDATQITNIEAARRLRARVMASACEQLVMSTATSWRPSRSSYCGVLRCSAMARSRSLSQSRPSTSPPRHFMILLTSTTYRSAPGRRGETKTRTYARGGPM